MTAAQAALDLAFYDFRGKARGVAVYELLVDRHRDQMGEGQKYWMYRLVSQR